jgi:hypothetical protein
MLHNVECYTGSWIMNLKNLEGCGHGLVEILTWHLPERTQENNNKLRITAFPAELRNEDLPNTSAENFRCAKMLGKSSLFDILRFQQWLHLVG